MPMALRFLIRNAWCTRARVKEKAIDWLKALSLLLVQLRFQYLGAQSNSRVGFLHHTAHGDEAVNLALKTNVLT